MCYQLVCSHLATKYLIDRNKKNKIIRYKDNIILLLRCTIILSIHNYERVISKPDSTFIE